MVSRGSSRMAKPSSRARHGAHASQRYDSALDVTLVTIHLTDPRSRP